MGICKVCGNDYDKAFEVRLAGESHVFDSFECAIHALAPRCASCGCTVIGHGVEGAEAIYCCAHCARAEGVVGVDDRADAGRRRANPETDRGTRTKGRTRDGKDG